jgi:hypothetical protein
VADATRIRARRAAAFGIDRLILPDTGDGDGDRDRRPDR